MSQFTSASMGNTAGFWLIVTAVIELLAAGVFLLLGAMVPMVDFGMFLTAGILGAVGIACLVIGLRLRSSAAANQALLHNGVAGQASITGLTQTGMYLNNNPQVTLDLLVSLPGRPPYQASRKEFVPLILLGRLGSGAPLPVRVDPADLQRLVIDWQAASAMPSGQLAIDAPDGQQPMLGWQPAGQAAMLAAAPGGAVSGGAASGVAASAVAGPASTIDESLAQVQAAMQASGAPVTPAFASAEQGNYTVEQLRSWLRQNGIAATARIDQVMDMGQVVGDERLFTIQATLELPGQPPRQLSPSAAMVPLSAASKVKVGWRVPVRVAAENHQLMMFEWEKV